MNAITKEEQTALTLPERAAVALGAADYEVKIKAKVAASTDITAVIDPAGREQAHRIGMDLLKLRTGITAAAEAARKDATAFSKAVIAKEKELVGLITPEETRVMTLRDGWDEKIAAEKAAKIAAERARTDAIQADIQNIRDTVAGLAGQPSGTIKSAIVKVEEIEPSEVRFAEFAADALKAATETIDKLVAMFEAAEASEAADLAAEEARKAGAARIEQERQELAKLRAENERVANEQAAERQRLANLAAAQEAEARRVREQAAANLRAEQEALAEQVRIQREAAAEQQRQLAAQQAEIDAKRAAFAREQEDAAARVEDAIKMEADHAEALADNAQFDADREAQREQEHHDSIARLQSLADQHLADKRDLPPPESCCARDARINEGFDETPTDGEILDVYVENFGGTREQAIERLALFDAVAARADLLVAA